MWNIGNGNEETDLQINFKFKKCYLTELSEKRIKELKSVNKKVVLRFKSKEIKTVELIP